MHAVGKREVKKVTIKVLTANAAGGKPPDQRQPDVLGEFIRKQGIDFVFLQELAELKWSGRTKDDDVLKQIEENAYQKYLSRGCEHGYDQQDWYEAEKELNTKSKKKINKKSKSK